MKESWSVVFIDGIRKGTDYKKSRKEPPGLLEVCEYDYDGKQLSTFIIVCNITSLVD